MSAGRLPVRVYYEDTDAGGVVYHASYLRFMERGRTEFLRERGVRLADLLGGGRSQPAAFVVRAMTIDFVAPGRLDDALVVETRVTAVGGASVTMAQRVARDGLALAEATVRVVLVAGGRAARLPAPLADLLREGSTPP